MKSIIVIIDYFGSWPEWFPIFLESCRWNPTIKWRINSNCLYNDSGVPNVEICQMTREEYIDQVKRTLNINFAPNDDYKLCDLRPAYGVLHYEAIRNYDFYGYGDLDVIYGNIRKFYTDQVLDYNVISTHSWCISGHFALIRNQDWLRNAFRNIPGWETILEDGANRRFDEDTFRHVFQDPPDTIHDWKKVYCIEQFTTPLTPSPWLNGKSFHPDVWYWKDGRIYNNMDGDREFIYLHFMNFRNARYMHPRYGNRAYWADVEKLVHVRPEDISKGVVIDRSGFRLLERSRDNSG